MGGSPGEPPRDAATQDNVTTDEANDHDLRDVSQRDVIAGGTEGINPKEVDRKAGLEDIATRTPLRRTQRFRK